MAAARQFRSPLRAATLETLIGLLAVSGLRVAGVLRLNQDDVDFAEALLHVRNSKRGKSRVVPLHPTTLDALKVYSARRDELIPHPRAPSFFVSTTGTRLRAGNLRQAFVEALERSGVPPRVAHRGWGAFVIRWPWPRWFAGMSRARTCQHSFPCCPRSSATSTPFHLLVLVSSPRAVGRGGQPAGAGTGRASMTALAPTVEAFFAGRLITQRRASPRTT
jgi:hypothetical protein